MKKLAVFASGNGTNAEAIVRYFENSEHAVSLIVTNNPEAAVLQRAQKLVVESLVVQKLKGSKAALSLVNELKIRDIDAIALAGYLKLIPPELLDAFEGRIWNIHPALLPAFGGKGMYGDRIHRKVLKEKASTTGITIHQVSERYDEGKILFQAAFPVEKDLSLNEITEHIHRLEHQYYPKILELLLDQCD